jgi:hypothetical protein
MTGDLKRRITLRCIPGQILTWRPNGFLDMDLNYKYSHGTRRGIMINVVGKWDDRQGTWEFTLP